MPRGPLEQWTNEQLIAGMRELRKENEERRKSKSQLEQTLDRVPEEIGSALIQMIEVYAGDRVAGAELMRDISNDILRAGSPETEEEETMTDADPTAGEPQDMTEILDYIRKQDERIAELEKERDEMNTNYQEQQRADAVAYLAELGYEENGPKWDDIVRLVQSDLAGYDIDKAHELYQKLYGTDETTEGQPEVTETKPEPEPEPEADDGARKFPSTGVRGSVGTPGAGSGQAEDLDLSKEAVAARARAYLENYQEAANQAAS